MSVLGCGESVAVVTRMSSTLPCWSTALPGSGSWVDRDEHLVKMPFTLGAGPPAKQVVGVSLPELGHSDGWCLQQDAHTRWAIICSMSCTLSGSRW